MASPWRGAARAVLHEQLGALRLFIRRRALLVVVVIYWVERVSNGLNAAVVPFFMRALALSPSQMGLLATIARAALLTTAPLYGLVVDARGPLAAIMVASSLCSAGCMLRSFSSTFGELAAAMVMTGAGGANLVPLISAHLARETRPAVRPLVLSAFALQGAVLRIVGQGLFIPWDALLDAYGVHDRVTRFRVTLSICSFGCVFGVINLWLNGHLLSRATLLRTVDDGLTRRAVKQARCGSAAGDAGAPVASELAYEQELAEEYTAAHAGARSRAGAGSGPTAEELEFAEAVVALEAISAHEAARGLLPAGGGAADGGGVTGLGAVASRARASSGATLAPPTPLLALSLVLATAFVCSMADTVLQLVWPLYLSLHYGYAEHEYGALLFASTLLVTLISIAVPPLMRRHGPAGATAHVGAAAAVCLGASFLIGNLVDPSPAADAFDATSTDGSAVWSAGGWARVLHVCCALLAAALLGGLDLCLRAIGSLLSSQAAQGRSFAGLNLAASLGGMAGGMFGGRLFQLSTSADEEGPGAALPRLLRGGALPTTLLAPVLLLCCALLSGVLRRHSHVSLEICTSEGERDRESEGERGREQGALVATVRAAELTQLTSDAGSGDRCGLGSIESLSDEDDKK